MNTLVVGVQYGNEGKGRVSHILFQKHDWAIRFNGGPNAGHTVYHNDVKHKLHHLLDQYKDFLLQTFPQIKCYSESPDGDLIEVP